MTKMTRTEHAQRCADAQAWREIAERQEYQQSSAYTDVPLGLCAKVRYQDDTLTVATDYITTDRRMAQLRHMRPEASDLFWWPLDRSNQNYYPADVTPDQRVLAALILAAAVEAGDL